MFLIIAILFVSCDKTSIMNNTDDGKNLFRAPGQEITYENVNAYVASVVAKKFISFMDERFASAEVVSIQPIVDLEGKIEMYAVNFNPKGYVITSADIRNEPIFSFSTEDNVSEISFNKDFPDGFLSLLNMTMSFNKWIREEGEEKAPELVFANLNDWEDLSRIENNMVLLTVDYIREKLKDKIYSPISCSGYTYEKDSVAYDTGILLRTTWGQNKPYNCYVPNNYPAGCVAVAMAQIMKYHRHPQNIKWDIMPNNSYYLENTPCDSMTLGEQEMAQMIANIGYNTHTLYASGGSTSFVWWARKSFVEDYNYSHDADIETLDFKRMVNQLKDKRLPLYYSATIPLAWPNNLPDPTEGHAFVIDGYRQNVKVYTKYDYDVPTCTPPIRKVCTINKDIFLHVNFGGSGSSDGWYNVYWKHLRNGDFEPYISWPQGKEYTRFILCIYDIHP